VRIGRPYKALIGAGYAYADLALAEKARDDGDRNELGRLLDDVQQRTEDVIAFDQNFALAYVLLARRYAFEENYDEALTILNQGLAVPKLFGDLNLRVEKAEIYYRQGEYALASQEVFEILYINPYSEQARLLQIRSTLASNQPGLAVIYTQQYLFFFPGSTLGYKLLGDARVAEGNSDQALDAYTQALQGDENDPAFLEALLARAQLYSQQRRYDLARDDLTQALSSRSGLTSGRSA
jgi:tetratricopeptide (TPR) repeat protein